MALIKCPECGKEISDSVKQCPHCGYEIKKQKSKKPVIAVIIIVIVVLAGGAASYLGYFRPNSIMNQAENLIDRGKYSDADVLLASVPSGNRKTELMIRINVGEAREALNSGDYTLAEKILADVPEDSIPQDLQYSIIEQKVDALIREDRYDEADELFAALPQTDEIIEKRNTINREAAEALLSTGQYIEAEERYARMEQTEDVIALRKSLFYESRVLQCSLMVKDTLIFPESMQVAEALLFTGGKTKNAALSNSETEIYDFDQPEILLHYRAQTRGGSITDGFVRFDWYDNAYRMNTSVDTLKSDSDSERERKIKYMDSDELSEYREEQLEISLIELMLMVSTVETILEDEQLARVNQALQATPAKSVEFIPNNDIVPLPTPEAVAVTPAPTATPVPTFTPEPWEEVSDAAEEATY